jgi:chromosomal replication initiation ATPase DnaA
MSTLSEVEKLKTQVHNLQLNLKRKTELVNKLKEAHALEVQKIKKEYGSKLLHLRISLAPKKIRGDNTINILCDVLNSITGVTGNDILSKSRKRDHVVPRYVLCHILRLEGKTYQYIGKHISGKHHATIIHAIRVVEDWIENPIYYKTELDVYNKAKNMFDDIKK